MSLEKNHEIKWIETGSLKEHPQNNNKHPKEQIERLAKVIKYQGFRSPITVSNLSGYIVAGHARLKAAKEIGMTKVPVSYQDFADEAQEYAHLTADNALALWAKIDMSAVEEYAKSIDVDFDLDFLGFNDFSLPDEVGQSEKDDAVPDTEDNEFGVELGDIYQLGEHRLMCGDSTDEETVSKLMNGEKADMVFTDPPYGMDLNADYSKMVNKNGQAGNKHKQVAGDSSEDFSPELIESIFNNFSYCKEMIIFGADYFAEHLYKKNEGSWLVWDKRVEEKFDAIIGSGFELMWSKSRKKREIIRFEYSSWASRMADNVEGKKPHPTMKPVLLIEKIFLKFKSEKLIVDLFLGSGSTLIACEKTNRKCYGMELDPHYCSVIIKRWEDYTGKKAEKLDE